MIELTFPLKQEEDWPPASKEAIHCEKDGIDYRVLVAPYFIKGLSVGDLIHVDADSDNEVRRWKHVEKSKNSVIWIKSTNTVEPALFEEVLGKLKSFSCDIERLSQLHYYSINIPVECNISDVDRCLDKLDNSFYIAYPSFRH